MRSRENDYWGDERAEGAKHFVLCISVEGVYIRVPCSVPYSHFATDFLHNMWVFGKAAQMGSTHPFYGIIIACCFDNLYRDLNA